MDLTPITDFPGYFITPDGIVLSCVKENNQQTIDLEHITRNELGQFESNLNKKS